MDQVQPDTASSAKPNEAATAPTPPTEPTVSREERLEALYPNDAPKDAPATEKPQNAEAVPQGRYSLTAPEGFEIDNVVMEAASPVFGEIGLTNDQAQKMVPLAIKFQERLLQRQQDEFDAIKSDWAKQLAKDPEIGGEKLKSTQRLAGAALEAAGVGKGHEFRKLMDQSGLGNHPVVLKVFARLGRLVADQATKEQIARRAGTTTRLERLYPND